MKSKKLGLELTEDSAAQKTFGDWRKEINGTQSSNMTIIDEAVGQLQEDVQTLNDGGLVLKDTVIDSSVKSWLTAHPEATTTVQDGSITADKLAPAVKQNVEDVPGLKQDLGDLDFCLSESIAEIANIGNKSIFDKNLSTIGYQIDNYGGNYATSTMSITQRFPIKYGKSYTFFVDDSTLNLRCGFYNTEKGIVALYPNFTCKSPKDLVNLIDWFTKNEDGSYTFTIPTDFVSANSDHRTIDTFAFTYYNTLIDAVWFVDGDGAPSETFIIAPVPYIDEKLMDIEKSIIIPDTHTVLCYGDSLTMGAGGNGTTYPIILQNLLGDSYVVNNYGVGGETAQTIAGRQGGVPLMVQPLECDYNSWVDVNFKSIFGFTPNNLLGYQSNAGLNPCTVNGKNVSLYWSGSQQRLRNNETEKLTVDRPTKLIPYSATLKNKTIIIWSGTNGWGDEDVDTLVNMQKCMIDYNGNNQYIVIGLHKDSLSARFDEIDKKQVQAFGEHYINIRKYLVDYGLEDANITPTATDTTRIAQGLVPSSLLADGVHFTAKAYEVIANVVYKKGKELGLWE